MEVLPIDERLAKLSSLSREAQFELRNDILKYDPRILRPWHWWSACEINVLLVTDGPLDFDVDGFGLSTFFTIFKKLEDESFFHISYKVTLAHRDPVTLPSIRLQSGNPNVHNRIPEFRFDNPAHFQRDSFDQVWLFGFSQTGDPNSLSPAEIDAVEDYMNHGGGLFATGDHGDIGYAMCSAIPRVKDMRIWTDTADPFTEDHLNEVSMRSRRRNDTNQPKPGEASSTQFSNQRDDIPQTIDPKLYSGIPHPLLSVKTSIRPDGIIRTMPDHPHEGECTPETVFTVHHPRTGVAFNIPTQVIATSFVPSGNYAFMKWPTDPQCFPSISVFDGRPAGVGRIAIDSTWHHFVNVNLEGLLASDYEVIEEYYKNIAKWISRSKFMICLAKRAVIHGMFSERIMEASMDNPRISLEDIPVNELAVIGKHMVEVVAEEMTPADAVQVGLTLLEPFHPELANRLNPWATDRQVEWDDPSRNWLNPEGLLYIAMGTGVIAVRDEFGDINEPIQDDDEARISQVFDQGMRAGLQKAIEVFQNDMAMFATLGDSIVQDEYLVQGTVVDAGGNPAPNLVVRAFDQDFTGENRLGQDAITDEQGAYSIPYKETDFVLGGVETGGADIILYIYDANGNLLKQTEPNRDSPKQVTIDVQLDG